MAPPLGLKRPDVPMAALRKAFDSYLANLDDGDDPFEFNESKNMRKGQAPKVASLLESHKLLKTLAPYFVHGVPTKKPFGTSPPALG